MQRKNPSVSKLARVLRPPKAKAFCALVKIGRTKRQLICFARSELGAKRIAGRFYRELYPDRIITVLSFEDI
jgi:hypothetical protein